MTDPYQLIEQGCYLCLRFGLEPSLKPAGCLEVTDGLYALRKDARRYHPLETLLIGEKVCSGEWTEDAAMRLDVSGDWVEGFIDAFALASEQPRGQEYLQGYLTAEELRARCFRRLGV